MTQSERQKLIESYRRATAHLTEALKQFPREAWHYKPAPNRWSIHEIVIHLAESEANSFVRARCFLSEPGKTLLAYDQDQWAIKGRYADQNAEVALQTFKWLRESTYLLIKDLPESVWSNTAVHPERDEMTFDEWLVIYEEHARKHIGQMQRNFAAWQAQSAVSR